MRNADEKRIIKYFFCLHNILLLSLDFGALSYWQNYTLSFSNVVNIKSTILNRIFLKSIKDFKPKLHSYPNAPPILSFKTTTISGAFISLFPNSIDRLGTR